MDRENQTSKEASDTSIGKEESNKDQWILFSLIALAIFIIVAVVMIVFGPQGELPGKMPFPHPHFCIDLYLKWRFQGVPRSFSS